MSEYPIPVHCELKGTRGKIRPSQIIQRERIERSGSIYLLIDNPIDFHKFFFDHGFVRITFAGPVRKEVYTEKEVNTYVREYLKLAEKIYGIYWERNHQSLGNTHGRPDYYFEIPNLKPMGDGREG